MHSRFESRRLIGSLFCLLFLSPAAGADLEVGPGTPFRRIEDAPAAAKAGDGIIVHPEADGQPYARTALLVRTPRLTFRAVKGPKGEGVGIDGTGSSTPGRGASRGPSSSSIRARTAAF